jgi:hypothetical protein
VPTLKRKKEITVQYLVFIPKTSVLIGILLTSQGGASNQLKYTEQRTPMVANVTNAIKKRVSELVYCPLV